MTTTKLTKREQFMANNPHMLFTEMATQLSCTLSAIERTYDRLEKKRKHTEAHGCDCNDQGKGQYHLPGCPLHIGQPLPVKPTTAAPVGKVQLPPAVPGHKPTLPPAWTPAGLAADVKLRIELLEADLATCRHTLARLEGSDPRCQARAQAATTFTHLLLKKHQP